MVEYTFLAEFDLLRHGRIDIRTQTWTDPLRRQATLQYLRLQRAKEEIQRLNIEIRRLRTAIHDEEQTTMATLERLTVDNSPLVPELCRQWTLRSRVNAVHIARLNRIEALPGFSGICGIGIRINSTLACTSTSSLVTSDPLIDGIVCSEMANLDAGHSEELTSLEEAAEVLCAIDH